MRVTTITCDKCGSCVAVVHQSGIVDGEFCSVTCVRAAQSGEPVEEGCQHEDNMSDEVAGRSKARLICKQCGYDREEEVA